MTRIDKQQGYIISNQVPISALLAGAKTDLENSANDATDTARLDAEILLAHCLRKNRAYLFTWPEKIPDQQTRDTFQALIAKRCDGIPLAYLTGEREFWSLTFKVTPDTLIPRPETELIVQLALDILKDKQGPVLDLGTGSGAIAISIASEVNSIEIDAADNSVAALVVAKENAAQHNVNVNFIESDWFDGITRTDYQLVVSNPPYIAKHDPHLRRGGLQHEPIAALQAADSGMAAIKRIAGACKDYCAAGAWLLIEHGHDQGPKTRKALEQAGFNNIQTGRDLESRDRVTLGQLPK